MYAGVFWWNKGSHMRKFTKFTVEKVYTYGQHHFILRMLTRTQEALQKRETSDPTQTWQSLSCLQKSPICKREFVI